MQYSFCPVLRELPEPNLRSGVQGAIADCLAILDNFRDHRKPVLGRVLKVETRAGYWPQPTWRGSSELAFRSALLGGGTA